ncbi:hypothetical protein SLEP1_g31028 [Rubroshorea leprosula]|uniref:Uncharacterized protein n=1 Tax=Rubroshorea leprosula TaxID=152421 RepID=A0AAV5K252_9ROSI|nr:hypothetical protein SLEP1_g31028 [Rubroshorea leprosula]
MPQLTAAERSMVDDYVDFCIFHNSSSPSGSNPLKKAWLFPLQPKLF